MSYKDGDIVLYKGSKYILRVLKSVVTGKDMYFLCNLDGSLYTSDFKLSDITLANSVPMTGSFASGGYQFDNSESQTSYSSSSRSYSSRDDVDPNKALEKADTSQKLSDDIGSLFETEKTMEDCRDIIANAKEIIKNSNIALNTWEDVNNAQGLACEASIAYLSNLVDSVDSLCKNLDSTSEASVALNDFNKTLKTLLIKYSEKKEKKDLLVEKQTELASTPKEIPDGVDDEGNTIYKPNPRIAELEEEIAKLLEEIEKLDKEIDKLKFIADHQYKVIKTKYDSLSSLTQDGNGLNVTIDDTIFGSDVNVDDKLLSYVGKQDNMLLYSYDGSYFYVPNTAISIDDYASYVQNNGLYQNCYFMGNRCIELASIYAEDMITGDYTSKSQYTNSSIYNRMNDITFDSTSEIQECIYNEVLAGRPLSIQVSQKKGPGYRHFVTVVGFDSSVTSASDLTPENILVLDCFDGKIQRLSERNRTLTRWGDTNTYRVNLAAA